MAKLIIGILLVFAGILVVLLLFIIFTAMALLVYARRGKIAKPTGETEGPG